MKKIALALSLVFIACFTDVAVAADVENFTAVGTSAVDEIGLTIKINSLDIVEKTGSFTLTINYTETNNTSDKKLDEVTFKLFFTDRTGEPQYGAFNYLYPGDTKTRSYTWEYLKSRTPWLIEANSDFFGKEPSASKLHWKVGSGVPVPSATPTLSQVATSANVLNYAKYVQNGRSKSVTFKFLNSNGTPAANQRVLFASNGVGFLAENSGMTDANGFATVRYIVGMELGQASITAANSNNLILSQMNFDVGVSQAAVEIKSRTIAISATYAAGKTVSVFINGIRKLAQFVKVDDPQLFSWTVKKGTYTINARISGGISVTKKYVVK